MKCRPRRMVRNAHRRIIFDQNDRRPTRPGPAPATPRGERADIGRLTLAMEKQGFCGLHRGCCALPSADEGERLRRVLDPVEPAAEGANEFAHLAPDLGIR